MKKRFKRALAVVITAVMILTAAPMSGFVGLNFDWLDFSTKSSALASTGQCGSNVYWTFDESTGALTISGTGNMDNYIYISSYRSPFYNNQAIKSVVIESGVTSIGNYAFHGCTGLTSVTIPNSVTSIGGSAFYGCTGLMSVTIPDSVTSIGSSAFSGCTGLTSVTIPDSVTSIDVSAFSGCTGLMSVTIPDNVTSIGDSTFSNVANVVYHGTAFGSPWGARSLNGYTEYPFVYSDSTKTTLICCITSYKGDITISDNVTSIGNNAFSKCTGLTSVTIPDSVTSIGSSAFSGCTGLTSVTIPDSVTSIGSDAFYNTGYYNNSDNWENDVLYIGNHLNKAKTSLSGSYQIKPNTKTICCSAFSGCNGLTSITIPDSLTNIGYRAFYHCIGLTRVNISSIENWCNILFYYEYIDGEDSSNPLYYAHNLFFNGELVTDLVIPDSVTSIGSYTFYNCTGLTSVTIPDSVTSIGERAFYGCKGLTSVTIPDSVTSVDSYAFSGCTGLTSVTIPDSVTSIGDRVFYNCTGLTSVTIPDNVTSIGYYAFSGCTGLTTVYYNAVNCTSMSSNFSFYFTNFSTLYIGENVESIPDYAFKGCTSLQKIVFSTEDYIEIGNGAFDECYNAVFCCRENSYMHYYADRKGLQYCILDEGGNPSFTVENDILVSYSGSGENIFVSSASKIGYAAFDGNENLVSVELASNVTRIYNQAFRNCSNLEKIIIPKNVSSIGSNAFSGCDKLTIWCWAGSYAEKFAANHDIPYTLIKLNISDPAVTLAENETVSLTASFSTALIDEDKITWSSSDTDVAVVENGVVSVVDFGEAQITASTPTGLSAVCTVSVDLKLNPGASADIERESGIVTGADIVNKTPEDIKDLFVNSNIAVSSSGGKSGTGSAVTLYKANGDVYKEITIVVFGDVNGDGIYDAQDATIVNCLANGLLTREQVGEAKYLAADCNHDGEVNSTDVLILEQAGLLLSQVDQSKDDYMQSDAYAEYLDLIDQTPTSDESAGPSAPAAGSFFAKIIEIFKAVIDFIFDKINLLT